MARPKKEESIRRTSNVLVRFSRICLLYPSDAADE